MPWRSLTFPRRFFRQTPRNHAVRDSLFGPGLKTELDLRKNYNRLLFRFRERTIALHGAGWSLALRQSLRMSNCPPAGFYTPQKSRQCLRAFYCPWCWGRKVAQQTYDKAEQALYGTNHKWVQGADGLRVQGDPRPLSLYATREITEIDPGEHPREFILNVRNRLPRTYHKFFQKTQAGSAQTICFEPVEGSSTQWRVFDCGLFLVDLDVCVPDELVPKTTDLWERPVQYYPAPVQRDNLAEAVGWAFRYPKRILTAPIEKVLPMLQARFSPGDCSVRLLSFKGVLRGNPISDQGESDESRAASPA